MDLWSVKNGYSAKNNSDLCFQISKWAIMDISGAEILFGRKYVVVVRVAVVVVVISSSCSSSSSSS